MTKMSINQGPYIGSEHQGFTILPHHCQEISNFLWEWHRTLPGVLAAHIEAIIVGPYNTSLTRPRQLITIKIICSGGGKISWKKPVEMCIPYFPTTEKILADHPKLDLQLNDNLENALKEEKSACEDVAARIADLVRLVRKTERSLV